MDEAIGAGMGMVAIAGFLEALEVAVTTSYGLLPDVLYVVGAAALAVGLGMYAYGRYNEYMGD